jgi:hypothetical protein
MRTVCWLRAAIMALAVAATASSLLVGASEATVMAEASAAGRHGTGPGGTVEWVILAVLIIALIVYRFVWRGRRR